MDRVGRDVAMLGEQSSALIGNLILGIVIYNWSAITMLHLW